MIQPRTMYSVSDDPCVSSAEVLYNAIILQAVKDFRQARRRLKRRPDDKAAMSVVREVSRFFRSDYFSTLTRLDGQTLLNRLMTEDNQRKAFPLRGEARTTASGRNLVRAEVKL